MKRTTRHPGIGMTMFCAALILLSGTAVDFLSLTLFSSPSGEVIERNADELQNQTYIFTPSELFSLYPWNTANLNTSPALTEKERSLLYDSQVPHFIANLIVNPAVSDMEYGSASGSPQQLQQILDAFRRVTVQDAEGTPRQYDMLDSSTFSFSMYRDYSFRAAVDSDGQVFSLYPYQNASAGDAESNGSGLAEEADLPEYGLDADHIDKYVYMLLELASAYGQKKLLLAFEDYAAGETEGYLPQAPIQFGSHELLISLGSLNGIRRFLIYDQSSNQFCGFHLQDE